MTKAHWKNGGALNGANTVGLFVMIRSSLTRPPYLPACMGIHPCVLEDCLALTSPHRLNTPSRAILG